MHHEPPHVQTFLAKINVMYDIIYSSSAGDGDGDGDGEGFTNKNK